jgi:hypothetical protein
MALLAYRRPVAEPRRRHPDVLRSLLASVVLRRTVPNEQAAAELGLLELAFT